MGTQVDHEPSRIVCYAERAPRRAARHGPIRQVLRPTEDAIQTGTLPAIPLSQLPLALLVMSSGADPSRQHSPRHNYSLEVIPRAVTTTSSMLLAAAQAWEVDTAVLGVRRLRHRVVTQIGTDNFAVCRNIQQYIRRWRRYSYRGSYPRRSASHRRAARSSASRTVPVNFTLGRALSARLAHEHDLCSPHCSRHLEDRLRDDRLDGGVGHLSETRRADRDRNVIHESVAALFRWFAAALLP